MSLINPLDLPTLLWVALMTNAILGISVLFVARRLWTEDGLAAWGWGMLLHALSYPAFGMRAQGWPALSIVVYGALISGTLALHALAIWQFQRNRSPALHTAVFWGPVLAMIAVAATLPHQHALRTVPQSAILCGQGLLMAWLAWAPWSKAVRERGRLVLTGGSLLLALALLGRGISVLSQDQWNNPFLLPPTTQAFVYLIGLAVTLLNTIGYVLMHNERSMQLLQTQARLDMLTGIPNRRALLEQIERDLSLAARQSTPMSLLMIDIDHFKQVNDTHGHLTGDAVLRHVAKLIARRVRRYDGLGRYGGEEFLVALPATDAVGARVVAEAIRRTIEGNPLIEGGRPIPITVSVGVHTRVPQDQATELNEMIAECDRAMYRAKDAGRNRIDAGA